ncbi:unnamed protein product [Discosporangium mesarthrocarpum]
MSHYTAIQTKYTNEKTLKKVLTNLNFNYTQHKTNNKIEIYIPNSNELKNNILNNFYPEHLTFKVKKTYYELISDYSSWRNKENFSIFLNKIELNYNYSETINQALKLGFVQSKSIKNKSINRLIFQRCVEIK